ncbi:selenium-binding protein SBP56-related protein [Leptospira sp. 96542]|nr:selenium-binding protein SBP56-related protein [Leptospira sp. 96542]
MKIFLVLFFILCNLVHSQTILSEFSFTTNFETRPTFYETDSPFFVNNGKWVYIGKTADFDEPGLYFFDLESSELVFKSIPLETYFNEHQAEFLGSRELSGKQVPFNIHQFLYLENDSGSAGLVVENKTKSTATKRYYYLGWNIHTGKVEQMNLLYEIPAENSNAFAMSYSVGMDKQDKSAFFIFAVDSNIRNKNLEDVDASIYKIQNKKLDKLYEYKLKEFPYTPILSSNSKFIFIATYAESYQKLDPKGFLFQLENGSMNSFPIPSVPYGICFSKDDKFLYVSSGETGEVKKYNTNDPKEFIKSKWGTHGHKLGFWNETDLLWVRNSGIHIYDAKTLKQKKVIPTKKYYKGHVNVSGSEFYPFQKLLLRNGLENPKGGASIKILAP